MDTAIRKNLEVARRQEAGQNLRADKHANPRKEQVPKREEQSREGGFTQRLVVKPRDKALPKEQKTITQYLQ
jgi:hypothetical protein